MKICPKCSQSYTDDTLNFCLNDGSMLTPAPAAEPRTIVMDRPRVTDRMSWEAPPDAQPPMWREPSAMKPVGPSINLPIISLTLGVFSLILVCCYFGFVLGPAAVIIGIIALNQEKRDPERFGGKGIAIGGIVTGAIAFLITLGFLLIGIIGNLA